MSSLLLWDLSLVQEDFFFFKGTGLGTGGWSEGALSGSTTDKSPG